MSSPETLSAALKQLEGNVNTHRAVSQPGSEKEPVHIRFGDKSHFGEDQRHGDHYATKVNGNNVHIGNYGSFILGPEGRATWGEMTPEIKATLAILRAKTGYGRFDKAAADKPYRDRVEVFGAKDGKILIGNYQNDGTFGTFGGGMDKGEDPVTAGKREYEEETGMKLKNAKLLDIPPVLLNWGPPFHTDKQRRRAKKFKGSSTQYVLADIAGQGTKGIGEDADSPLSNVRYLKAQYLLRMMKKKIKEAKGKDVQTMGSGRVESIKQFLKNTTMDKAAMEIPIEKGDILLTGRYKNKRMEVKEIGVDELGQFTVNGQKLLACRIEKLMPKNKQSKKTQEMQKEAFEFTHKHGLASVAVLTALGAGAGAAYAKRDKLKKLFNKFVEPQITVTSGGGPGVGLRLRGTPLIADIDATGPGAGVLIPASAASKAIDLIPGKTADKWAKKLKNAPGSIYAGAEMAGIIPIPHIGISAGMDDKAKLGKFVKDLQGKPKKKRRSLQKIGEDVRAITNTNSIASGQKIDFDPSEAKKKSENYKKAHVKMDGFDVSIENPIGSIRKGKSPDGTEWECPIHADYGYIKGSKGYDKDHVDVTIKPGYKGGAKKVHVVNQVDDKGKFDEHKIVIGATNKNEAENVYSCNYEAGWDGAGSIMEMPMEEFRRWVYSNAPSKGAVEKEASSAVDPSLKSALAQWDAPNVPVVPKTQTPVPTHQPGEVLNEVKPQLPGSGEGQYGAV